MRSPAERPLDWEGCSNTRDLGGLPIGDAAETRWGAVVRSDSVERLTAAGWSALIDHGVRTVVDLRNDDELGSDAAPRPASIKTIRLPLDQIEDTEFWDDWLHTPKFGTPLYFAPHLKRFPHISAAVLAAIAEAPEGGVLFHCRGGHDRSGQITMLLLALVGVSPADIAADYALSREEPDPEVEAFLASQHTTAGDLILKTLEEVDVEATMRDGGLTDAHITALRQRLTAPKTAPA